MKRVNIHTVCAETRRIKSTHKYIIQSKTFEEIANITWWNLGIKIQMTIFFFFFFPHYSLILENRICHFVETVSINLSSSEFVQGVPMVKSSG